MTCQHRWKQVTYIKHINPNRYMYQCTRCGNIISAILKGKT